jgi:hypothetical protein
MINWITPAGTLATLTERVIINIPLEATSPNGPVTFTLIAGSLPRGLRINNFTTQDSTQTNGFISGSPVEVKKYTTSRFVIRASDGIDLEDRTFSINVDGTDIPVWTTKEGFLNVGLADSYFILDNSRVDFQLVASDDDETAGDILEYYLLPMAGELPPGLSLSTSGRITGFTDPIFALEYSSSILGGYDTSPWDVIPLDFVEARSNGFDSYFYDNVNYDYSESSRTPRRLSRVYTFGVAVTDGVNSVNRIFKIYVVTEEFLQADNSIVQVDTNLFQADSGSSRLPLWITESNLGRFRANNYVTLFLEVYDPPTLSGTITYFLLNTNPGTYKLKSSGEIISNGRWEVSNIPLEFKYTFKDYWNASTVYNVGDVVIYRDNVDSTVAQEQSWVCQTAHTGQLPANNIYWNKELSTSTGRFNPKFESSWEVITPETASVIPPGTEIDSTTGEIAGRVPYQARVTKNYQFTVMAVNFPLTLSTASYTLVGNWNSYTSYKVNDSVRYLGFTYLCIKANLAQLPTDTEFWELGVSSAEKTFTVELVGEIESAVNWISDSDCGTIKPNQPSQLYVAAESLLYGGHIAYEFVSGTLPPGLEFIGTGSIQGKVRQFADDAGPGLTRFYEQVDSLNPSEDSSTASRDFNVTFDDGDTTFDKKFTFTILARDSVSFAESLKTFFINVVADNTKTFANLYVKAFQSKAKRLAWYDFITDSNIFKPDELYRYGDNNFGIQTDLKMLVYAGIESVEAVKYIQAMSRNHNNKRMLFGDVKSSKAKDPLTQEPLYEVVYVNMIDEYEKNGVSTSQSIQLSNTIESKVLISYDSIKVDSDIPFVSDSDHQRIFPNSIKNMRKRIRAVGDRDREFLPLWMRSIQDFGIYETGYVKALPLCFAVPGASTNIIARIKASGFDFKTIDFEADRYLIDIIGGEIQDKYLAFPQRGEKLP